MRNAFVRKCLSTRRPARALKAACLFAFALCAFAATSSRATAEVELWYIAPAWDNFVSVCGAALKDPKAVTDVEAKEAESSKPEFVTSADGKYVGGPLDTQMPNIDGFSSASIYWAKHQNFDVRRCEFQVVFIPGYEERKLEITEAKAGEVLNVIKQDPEIEVVGGHWPGADYPLHRYSVSGTWRDLNAQVSIFVSTLNLFLIADVLMPTDQR